ncbi:response regulator [Candidatus Woesearchaeota archaeon]|nr:response regulator [Candidatus Woesearchaeota archaeon]
MKKRKQRKTIMVVDDESDVTFAVKYGLEDLNPKLNVIEANSGRRCINLLRNGINPDLILLDIMMPRVCGWKTFDKIKENSSWDKIPIVFLTCRNDEYTINRGNKLGEGYITKPFEIDFLNEKITKILKQKRGDGSIER